MKSIIQTRCECYRCREELNIHNDSALDLHHVMNNPNKKASEKWGGMVWLCRYHHRELHDMPRIKTNMKREFQEKFELLYGHDLWMKEFHKNYL